MTSFVHLLYTPFTGLGLHQGFRGDNWLKNRITIFNRFVLPSISGQLNSNFILWVSWRPQEQTNPLVQRFYEILQGIRDLQVIFTFHGLCFWDDKYEKDSLLKRLKATLPELKKVVGQADWVYMTIQPSDDMYLSTAMDLIQKQTPEKSKVVGWLAGYIMNYATKEVAEYNPDTTPPFFTIMFPRKTFLTPELHYQYTGPYVSHEYIGDKLHYTALAGRGFVVGTHGENISTTFNHPYKGRVLADDERKNILWATNTYFADPFIVRKGSRLLVRNIINRLPWHQSLRQLYHRLPNYLQKF